MIAPTPPVEGGKDTREAPRTSAGGGGAPPNFDRPFGGGGGGGSGGGDPGLGERLKLGVWLGLAGVGMFFAALLSAMVVRRAGDDWRSVDPPDAFWLSTSLLVLSSGAYELARRRLEQGDFARLRGWLAAALALGLGFLAAQYLGWLDLIGRGVLIGESISGSFFYVLTGAHGAHVAGGLLALGYVAARAWSSRPWPRRAEVIGAAAVYWHFMGALWLCLFALLALWG